MLVFRQVRAAAQHELHGAAERHDAHAAARRRGAAPLRHRARAARPAAAPALEEGERGDTLARQPVSCSTHTYHIYYTVRLSAEVNALRIGGYVPYYE